MSSELSTLASETADQFEAVPLHNLVYETVQGQHTSDPTLTRVLELTEDCYQLADERGHPSSDDPVASAAFQAAEALRAQRSTLVDEAVAQACETLIEEGDEWTDAWAREELDAAQREARQWLDAHVEGDRPAEAVTE
jgi:hypothetical protein